MTLAGRPDATLDAEAREEWLARCEALYATVHRGLIAMGATSDDAADALQDAFEDALRLCKPVAHPGTNGSSWRRSGDGDADAGGGVSSGHLTDARGGSGAIATRRSTLSRSLVGSPGGSVR